MATSSSGGSSSTPTQERNMADGVPSIRAPKICRVNTGIREANPGEYEPQRVCIGALYLKTSDWMQEEKLSRLSNALSIHNDEAVRRFNGLVVDMESDVERVQQHYATSFSDQDSNKHDFAHRLLLDGYFVLSHFLERTEAGWRMRQALSDYYNGDIIFLLENQVPFFMLEKIYRLLNNGTADESNNTQNDQFVLQNIAGKVKTLIQKRHYVHRSVNFNNVSAGQYPSHLVHLLYMYFRPVIVDVPWDIERGAIPLSDQNDGSDQNTGDEGTDVLHLARWRSAVYYHAAGVRLAVRKLDGRNARSILDVELRNGTLQIPLLVIDGRTFTMLGNMTALEQHYPDIGSHMAIYCSFMAHLANTEEDVRLLSSKGILVNHLSNDRAVADGFAAICKGVIINLENPRYNYMRSIMEDLEKLCQSSWRKSMAWLRHSKCNNTLKTIGVGVAILVSVCTLEQSIFASLTYFLKNN